MKIKGFPFYFVNQTDLTELKQLEEKVEDPQLKKEIKGSM